ncbi:uncharacterized protein PGTG_00138 [Puccinia graminis f. sp. tritici CRL 75-36-700-3]|uniref:Phospho-2-dehydro-3-deoxyheptonate aldolase n=2 Tax=Puccinia graminis f. sp. tritici TaxID=56615 RepID=E3JR42_PUCGT|nr:uncharacterized protein PGTG_00138 [Puccinia graminis f. sp. tritici CRL 75-36-700-3]EFP74182.1 hypothetical protein PGTG_00138 [Puccinia graminis f. sp. tritici CRL 75-36-700-3]
MDPPAQPWSIDSWRQKPIAQAITYPPETLPKLENVKAKLKQLPGLVTPHEIIKLKERLKLVARGEAFLLHGGDCAELFEYCNHEHISARVKLLLMMSLIIIWGARIPVVRVGRIAGQFAKPRSQPTETIDGKEYPSFRGDIVNGYSLAERTPDPERLLSAYFHSSAIINHIRGLLASGLANLQQPSAWSFAHVRSPSLQAKFQDIVERLEDSLDFMRTIGANAQSEGTLGILDTVEIWTSHEALLLEYEEALTRTVQPARSVRARKISSMAAGSAPSIKETAAPQSTAPSSKNPNSSHESHSPSYDLSAHLVWVGERTRQLDHAHLEFLRGIANPVGVKLGPKTTPEELIGILDILNPSYEEGKILLICRFGANHVERCLPACIKAVQNSKHHSSIFCCDPMHGNTKTAEGVSGIKTRYLSDVVTELSKSIQIHAENGSRLSGVHLEMTGELDEEGYSVTECLGGSMNLQTQHLSLNYQTHCDPRLNYEQSLDIAFLIANQFQGLRDNPIIKQESILPDLN